MDYFGSLEGFYAQASRIWDDTYFQVCFLFLFCFILFISYFFFLFFVNLQISFSSISWFRDQVSFAVTGELDPVENVWIARFEFRASSTAVLTVFYHYVKEWLRESTKNDMQVLDGLLLLFLICSTKSVIHLSFFNCR